MLSPLGSSNHIGLLCGSSDSWVDCPNLCAYLSSPLHEFSPLCGWGLIGNICSGRADFACTCVSKSRSQLEPQRRERLSLSCNPGWNASRRLRPSLAKVASREGASEALDSGSFLLSRW